MILNPFIDDECNEGCSLPAICTKQPLEASAAVGAEISGIIILPKGAPAPQNWQTEIGWQGLIDNASTSSSVGKYLAVIGSYEPQEPEVAALSSGRGFVNMGRRWRLSAEAKNVRAPEACILREIDGGPRSYRFWLETIGGKLIGGPNGLVPIQRSAAPTYVRGGYEKADIALFFYELNFSPMVDAPYIPTEPPASAFCDTYLESVDGRVLVSVNNYCLEPI